MSYNANDSQQALKIFKSSTENHLTLIVLMCTTEKKLTELYLNVPFLKQTLTVMKTKYFSIM